MEELDLQDLLRFFLSKLVIIIIITIVVMGLGVGYMMWLQKPLYEGTTTLILTKQESQANTALTQNDVLLNQKLVSTYSEIIRSRRIVSQVLEKLDLPYTVEQLSKMLVVESVKDTELIRITVRDTDPKLAMQIANKTAEVFSIEIMDIYNIQNISIVEYAIEESKPYNINLPKQAILFTLLGGLSAVVLVFTNYYFDKTIKNIDMLEDKLGLPILGTVPKRGKGDKKSCQKN